MSLDRKILNLMSVADYRPLSPGVLGKQLGITKKRLDEFRTALQLLISSGKIRKGSDGLMRIKASTELLQGTIKKTAGGFGFLIQAPKPNQTEPPPDVFIPQSEMQDAHTGDEVLVQIISGRRGKGEPSGRDKSEAPRVRGRIVEILQRSTRQFVGTYFEQDGQGLVQVDGTTLNEPVPVGDPGAKGALPGDKVVFEMLRFPSQARGGEGVLTHVLGPRGKPGVDTLSIIHEFGLPDEFPEDVLEDARVQAEQFNEDDLQGRLDLTGETIITIDPVDARDFDDAISLERDEKGHWRLGVHIADVGHFVQPGSPLDREATHRGTSVYLPDRVIPMLPEIISNGLASLQPGRVRYTKSAFIDFSPEGIVTHTEFANSAIRSTKRFAYEEIMPIVNDPEKFKTKVPTKVRELVLRMYELAMLLRKRRFEAGSLELSMPEIKLDFNKQGGVTGAHVVAHDPSHQVIEEFMLAANVAVATALNDRHVPFLRRVHADPDEVKMRNFAQFVNALGYPLKRYQSRGELQKLLDLVQDTPHRHAVNFGFLRSLKQAEYSPEVLGHYALAADNYCHFTSPIRRYPDLMIHRLVGDLVKFGKIPHHPNEVELALSGKHCSRTERRAEQAERELIKVKLLTYLQDKIGLEMPATVTGAQEWGFYCQGIDLPAEGVVRVTTLDDDYYYLDQIAHTLIGRRTGKQYRLGDRLNVVVASVDINRRQLEFRVAGSLSAGTVRQPEPRDPTQPPGPQRKGPSRNSPGRDREERPRRSRTGAPPARGKGIKKKRR